MSVYKGVIIAGPRNLEVDMSVVTDAVRASDFTVGTVISGGASGVDRAAERWAYYNLRPKIVVKPDWSRYGLSAGPRRNHEMATMASALIVIKVKGVDTPGTSDMIKKARAEGLPVYVHQLER